MIRLLTLILFCFISFNSFAQFSMSNQTVYECYGTLTDSEANSLNAGWYDHNENYAFTICPSNTLSIIIDFTSFNTEPTNDYVMIYDGPNTTYPVLAGPFSGTNIPPQIISTGCVTIVFISDLNVAAEGFELVWEAEVTQPSTPQISFTPNPTCSLNTVVVNLDQKIHCDSVLTANYLFQGPINQNVSPLAINCINDSTNQIELTLSPGLNQSGLYDLSFYMTYIDECGDSWSLIPSNQIFVNDCPLELTLSSDDDTICLGECVNLYSSVSGGDSTSYQYSWTNSTINSSVINVCPSSTTTYFLTVNDNGPASQIIDSITIVVNTPPIAQSNIDICQTGLPIYLNASPSGGIWSGTGIISSSGVFSADGLPPGSYDVNYEFSGCSDFTTVNVLEINAGLDISACVNAPTFNLNTINTTAGGTWSGCSCIQPNGNIDVGGVPTIINAIYSLPNGCLDTIDVTVSSLSVQADDTLCQNSGKYPISFNPSGGSWTTLPQNPLLSSTCINSISDFPYVQNFEFGLNNWVHDPNNDFDWSFNYNSTPSVNTGPSIAFEGIQYLYTEASNNNHPSKTASIISPCLNLSQYNNPILGFYLHKYGAGQGRFSIDLSINNGVSWILDFYSVDGDLGNQWNEVYLDLSNFNSSELLIRFRVITGDGSIGPGWQGDVAIDQIRILSGPVTIDGFFLSDYSNEIINNLQYSIQGCDDLLNITIKEVDAGNDTSACPLQNPFNLSGIPSGGIWSGNYITNQTNGTFDPALASGPTNVLYEINGCQDTININVINTEILIGNYDICQNEGIQNLNNVPVSYAGGSWSGPGTIQINNNYFFDPNIAGLGSHYLIYELNSCQDSFLVNIIQSSELLDSIFCIQSNDILLNSTAPGGTWGGPGIINSNTGLFSPSSLSVGTYQIFYQSPSFCIDTFNIEIYNSPNLAITGIEGFYCNVDSNILVNVSPSGGILSGNGIVANYFNPFLAGEGYHQIRYEYGSGNCLVSVDTVIQVGPKLDVSISQSKDTICVGEEVKISSNAVGGNGNYLFSWDNGLSNSFEHFISPTSSTTYNLTLSDGCSEDVTASFYVFVHPSIDFTYKTSQIKCYGEIGYIKANMISTGNYEFKWNNSIASQLDSVSDLVGSDYTLEVIDILSNCSNSKLIEIPGYSRINASFFANINQCQSILSSEFQFIDNSVVNESEISNQSYWDYDDGYFDNYAFGINPFHTFSDTGLFNVKLFLINEGGCIDSSSTQVCVIPENKIHIPKSFTPNNDLCNDNFSVIGVGGFEKFSIKIFSRWGSEEIFKSNKIELISSSYNSCFSQNFTDSYYMMGEWDGRTKSGKKAQSGIYAYEIIYKAYGIPDSKKVVGTINLIR